MCCNHFVQLSTNSKWKEGRNMALYSPNGIQIAPYELFSVPKVNQSGHFMLTHLFWLSQLWLFSKSTDLRLHKFVVIISVRNIKGEITPKMRKHTLDTAHASFWSCDRRWPTFIPSPVDGKECGWFEGVVIFSCFWRPEWLWISEHEIRD